MTSLPNEAKVIAVVVTYNRLEMLKDCINALKEQSRKPDGILVVNNGSTDDTGEWIKPIVVEFIS